LKKLICISASFLISSSNNLPLIEYSRHSQLNLGFWKLTIVHAAGPSMSVRVFDATKVYAHIDPATKPGDE
jgi:hypothetical protein